MHALFIEQYSELAVIEQKVADQRNVIINRGLLVLIIIKNSKTEVESLLTEELPEMLM